MTDGRRSGRRSARGLLANIISLGYRTPVTVHARILWTGLAAFAIGATAAQAAPKDVNALLRRLIGKDEATVERTLGLPDRTRSNGVQTFLYYFNGEFRRTTGAPYPSAIPRATAAHSASETA